VVFSIVYHINKGVRLEENIPAQQCKEKKNLWFFIANEHKSWKKHLKQKEEKRQKKACGVNTPVPLQNAFSRTYAMRNPLLINKFSLGKGEKLLKTPEFKRVLRNGERQSTKHFKVFFFLNQTHKQRLGITASKKVGNAVKRNRIKRILREFFRLHKTCFPASSDILFIAKQGADQLDYSGLSKELEVLLFSKRP
jgi:ribonuclease P protein component